MAKIYKTDGTILDVEPKNKKFFKLEELQKIVGGYIEIVELNNGEIIVLNENGKVDNLPYNDEATKIYKENINTSDFIVGDILICKAREVK